ncbi:MAG: hypothetical protein GY854_24925, partial [Deltaproteobacteria bacterium]|nr:hypothetical protein [Deltaproteobacteria bacterium]
PVDVEYSNIEGGYAGTGNIDEDPRFFDEANGDLRLRLGSPCTDASDGDVAPELDILGNSRCDDPDVNTGVGTPNYVDMGAYEIRSCPGDEPCGHVICDEPPDDFCQDDYTVANYDPDGTCADSDCSYTYSEAPCEFGCESGKCICTVFVDINAAGASDGSSWADAYTTVQAGIDAAETAAATEGTCEVWVAEGTYYTYVSAQSDTVQLKENVHLYGGFAGIESLRSERDFESNVTVLDGHEGEADVYRVYHVVTGANDAVIDGFTITGGAANGSADQEMHGGGMYNDSVTPTLSNCVFENNYAQQKGGGLYFLNINGQGTLSIKSCVFRDNRTPAGMFGGDGGGVYLYYRYIKPNISNSVFVNNRAHRGGAVYIYKNPPYDGGNATDATIVNSVFNDNSSDEGTVIYYYGHTWAMDITNSTFSGNHCYSTSCSGTVYLAIGHSNIRNSIFWGNLSANLSGGTFDIEYSDMEGGYTGTGNIDADPLFVDAANGDLHIASGSPCIDAANGDAAPELDFHGNGRFDDLSVTDTGVGTPTYVDMGAFELHPCDGVVCDNA